MLLSRDHGVFYNVVQSYGLDYLLYDISCQRSYRKHSKTEESSTCQWRESVDAMSPAKSSPCLLLRFQAYASTRPAFFIPVQLTHSNFKGTWILFHALHLHYYFLVLSDRFSQKGWVCKDDRNPKNKKDYTLISWIVSCLFIYIATKETI